MKDALVAPMMRGCEDNARDPGYDAGGWVAFGALPVETPRGDSPGTAPHRRRDRHRAQWDPSPLLPAENGFPMRTTVKILSVVAAAACAVGLSACEDEAVQGGGGSTAGAATPADQPSAGAATPTGQPSAGAATPTGQPSGGSTAAAPAGAQAIEPVVFNDQAIGLTETCDQIVSGFDAPKYKAEGSHSADTVYLLHCTLDFSGDLSFDSESYHALTLVDDTDKYPDSHYPSSSLEDDMKQAGLDPINFDDYGTNHVDGWYAFTVDAKNGTAAPLPEGSTTLVYEREAVTGKGNGKAYEAYSSRGKVTVKG